MSLLSSYRLPITSSAFSDTFSKELRVNLVACISVQSSTGPLLTSHTCQIWKGRKSQQQLVRLASNTLLCDSAHAGPEENQVEKWEKDRGKQSNSTGESVTQQSLLPICCVSNHDIGLKKNNINIVLTNGKNFSKLYIVFDFVKKITTQSLTNSFSTSSRNYLNNWSICCFAFINTLT